MAVSWEVSAVPRHLCLRVRLLGSDRTGLLPQLLCNVHCSDSMSVIPTLCMNNHTCQQIPDPGLEAVSYLDAKLSPAINVACNFMGLKN